MKYLISAGAIALAALALPGVADAAPMGPETAAATISALQADGFHVILNKTGTAPLDQCLVDSVRPGQTFERADSGAPGAGNRIVDTVTAKTVYVDVDC